MFGTLERLRRAARGRPRARDEAGDGPRGQPHLRRAPVVRRVALEPRQPEARLVLVARPADQLALVLLRPAWELDEATGQYYLHLFSRKQPDLNWENPEVRQAIYAMMRWWLDRGVDGFRMDVINMISKDPALPDAPGGDGSPYYICGPRIHEFLQEMHREVFAGRDAAADRRRDAGRHARGRPAVHRPGARRGRHGVPVRARPARPGRLEVGRPRRCGCATSSARSAAGRTGSPSAAGTACTGTTTTSRGSSRASATAAPRRAKMLGTVLHLHRGTPYVYQGEELGMTNVPFASIDEFRDIESLNHYAEAGPDVARRPLRAIASRDNARTPMQWDASPHAGFTTGTPWLAVNPNHAEINAEAAARRPRLGLPPLPAADRAAPHRAGRRARRLHDAARGRRARLRVHAPARGHRAARARQLLRRGGAGRPHGLGGRRAARSASRAARCGRGRAASTAGDC